MSAEQPLAANPYVGPSTFKTRQAHLFFGREREARDLLARVVSERCCFSTRSRARARARCSTPG